MRIVAVIFIIVLFLFPVIIASIFAICGKGGHFITGYWWDCSKFKSSKIKEQKYVLRVYGIQKIIVSLIACSAVICLIYELWIAGGVLIALVIIALVAINIVLKKNKKFQQYKKEISDDKRIEEYLKDLNEKSQTDKEEKDTKQNDSTLGKKWLNIIIIITSKRKMQKGVDYGYKNTSYFNI